MKKKLRNYGLYVSIFSLIGLILQSFGLYEKIGLTNQAYQELVNAILIVLVGAGIISNPNKGKGFKDGKE